MEVELKFQVPMASRAALRRAVATRTAQRTRLQALYADTADDHLAGAGLALRLRKEGRVWVQTLKGRGDGLMQRLEHEVPLPAQRGEPALDPERHAGTPVGEQLQRVLLNAAPDQEPAVLVPLYRTDIQRLHRTLSHGGARIELALDEGWILAGSQRLPVFEIEFELKSGPPAALVALAQRWVARFGLVWDVRTKSERGFRLARGLRHVPAVRAPAVVWPRAPRRRHGGGKKAHLRGQVAVVGHATTAQAWSALLLSALTQVLPNAAELACEQPMAAAGDGDDLQQSRGAAASHLHQLRVGLRRLRTVLDLCAAWGPDKAAAQMLQVAWREPFTQLGAARDGDVLGGGLWPEIQSAGGSKAAPQLPVAPQVDPALATTDPADLVRQPGFSLLLLQSLALSLPVDAAAPADAPEDARHVSALPPEAARVLRRCWRQVRRDADRFDDLALEQQHRTRRRLKRLRYLLEGLLSLPGALPWPRAELRRWHRRLCRALDALGRYNDLCMADLALATATSAPVDGSAIDSGAWFARGWLSVQRPLAQAAAARRLHRLVQTPAPWPRDR
jgi:triphosphatase